jgi:hypothetical protein
VSVVEQAVEHRCDRGGAAEEFARRHAGTSRDILGVDRADEARSFGMKVFAGFEDAGLPGTFSLP